MKKNKSKNVEELLKARTRDLLEIKRQMEKLENDLEEKKVALKVLLEHTKEEKKELDEKVLVNIKMLALPYIEKLRNTRLDSRQKEYLAILESNINDIISPFITRLSDVTERLTPKEVEIAKLIKYGKTSKEIATLLVLSKETVNHHRQSIRSKLGLANQKINLRNHLLFLSK